MKSILPLTLAAAVSLLVSSSLPLRAADTDSRIESAAAKSYVFKTYLKDDAIKTESKAGVVTLTGTVADGSHKSMAEDTVASLPGVKRVDNQLLVSGEPPKATPHCKSPTGQLRAFSANATGLRSSPGAPADSPSS